MIANREFSPGFVIVMLVIVAALGGGINFALTQGYMNSVQASGLSGIEKQNRKPTYKEALDILEKTWNSHAYLNKPKKKEQEDRQLVEHMLKTYISWLESNENTVVDVEKDFQLEFEGVKITGNIDRIEKTPEGIE